MPTPEGSGPAGPVTATSRLTVWQAVRQSWLIRPDWTVTDHLEWLDDEAYDLDAMPGDPATVVAEWLAEYRHATTDPAPGPTPPIPPIPPTLSVPLVVPVASVVQAAPGLVYVVAGGSLVVAFADGVTAGIQHDVMTLAGIDTVAYRLTSPRWVQVRDELRARYPETEIVDLTGGDPS